MRPDYCKRRHKLRGSIGNGVIVLFRGGEHFNENLYYLTGLDTFFTAAIISLEDNFECLYVNPIEIPFISKTECGFEDIRSSTPDSITDNIVLTLKEIGAKAVFTDYSANSKTPMPPEIIDTIRNKLPKTSIYQLPAYLDKMRLKKDSYEIDLMKKGVQIIENIFESIKDMLKPGVSEKAIASEIYKQLVAGGFNKFFDISVASGANSIIPYYRSNSGILPESGVILIDIAAAIDYYICDLTRTFYIGGFQRKQDKELFHIVQYVHDKILENAVPGVTLGYLNKMALTMFKDYGVDQYYYNKIGHFVGLGVADPGDDSTFLEPGMVFTVEPGLYMIDRGMAIRKEDMIFL